MRSTTHFSLIMYKLSSPDVAVIILNWNGRKLLQDCIATVVAQTYPNLRMIVVDNGSTDDSKLWLEQYLDTAGMQPGFPDFFDVLALPTNLGFAGGINAGIQFAFTDPDIDYILTVNNDTELQPDFVAELVACAERHRADNLGSVQGQLVQSGHTDVLDATGVLISRDLSAVNRGRGMVRQAHHDNSQSDVILSLSKDEPIFGPSASAALYCRNALEATVLSSGDYFDSRYFLYYEDVDLAWRLRFQGYTSWYTPAARASHQHSATTGNHSPLKSFQIHRNHYFNIIKDLPWPFLLQALLLLPIRYILLLTSLISGHGPSAALAAKRKNRWQDRLPAIVLRSWWQVLRALPWLLRERAWIQSRRTVSYTTINHWFRQFRAPWRTIIYGPPTRKLSSSDLDAGQD